MLPGAGAQETPSTQQELKELKEALQQQTRQIELLAEQVGRLTRALQAQQKGPEVSVPTTSITPPTLAVPPPTAGVSSSGLSIAPKPLPPLPDLNTEALKGEAVPKAEAVPRAEAVPGTKHTVAKGETLTSIAKQYNISLADLTKANKIENDRKLQIGQILSIPAAKTSDTTDKKESP